MEPREGPPLRQVWGVSALLLAAADTLSARFGALAVRGELSGFARAASGHCYFALKDEDGSAALMRCAMFRRAAALLDFIAADGQKVELRGRLEVYEARGELQLVVESMQRVGVGTLYEEFLRLRARLEAAGLFDAARKRALPRYPAALGVVTSRAAAALHDVLTTLARRSPQVRVVVYPALVQGAQAPASIVEALELAGRRREVDALLLVRGGGSLEDLWAFNDERVVRAIVASPLPLVCGVGHETDVTLADLAADLRAPTPTAAAELAAPPAAELRAGLDAREAAIRRAAERALAARAQRLDALALRLGQPALTLRELRERLHAIARRLGQSLRPALAGRSETVALRRLQLAHVVAAALQRRRAALDALGARLAAEDPARVLARGYAWVEDGDGRPVVSAGALVPGAEVRAVWADGQARAEVLEVLSLPPHRR
ncbi:MAG: exodeoxyribonuclease VII large subunit [Burkholderiales bacterium]|nr:exodeoxyribonuclease VII large subunit [Burkholderiales bacterium]